MQLSPPPNATTLPPKNSGLAITSLVLGLVGLVPCLTIPCAPLALVFGIIALITGKKTGQPKGFAIAGTVLGSVCLFALVALLVAGYLSSKPKPFVAKAPEYETLSGEGLSGSGFHFRYGTRSYIACSLHQFDGHAPSFMLTPDLETEIPITKKFHSQSDVQILEYDETIFPQTTALVCEPKPFLSSGDPVYLIVDGEAVKAHVTRRSLLEGVWFETKKPFQGPGSSGSPVVSGLSGKVVGVMLGGKMSDDSNGMITEGYFEEFNLP